MDSHLKNQTSTVFVIYLLDVDSMKDFTQLLDLYLEKIS